MLYEILTRAPVWVWAILAFLVFRGIMMARDRRVSIKSVGIIPVVMLGLGLQGISSGFGATAATMLPYVACLALAAAVSWYVAGEDFIVARPETGHVAQRGSWIPLVLMMAIFITKFAVGVSLAMQAEVTQQAGFVTLVCAMYGAFTGIFVGRLLRTVTIYRAALRPSGLAA